MSTATAAADGGVILDPKQLRKLIRSGEFSKPTSGQAPGFLQCNMVILHKSLADAFKEFCLKNPEPCPLVAVLSPGQKQPTDLAPEADITTDLPKYRVFKNGVMIDEPTDIVKYWNDDLVTFLIGCSFTFEKHLIDAGVPVRNIEQGKNVSMFITNRNCIPVPPFSSPLVVSYRPVPESLVQTAITVTEKYGAAHGPPVHHGAPSAIGINDISNPDFGEAVESLEGDVPMFWACGVTSTMAALSSGSDLVITHCPGHMFVTDKVEK